MLNFISSHFEALVNLVIAIVGLVMASGFVENAQLKKAITESVNFVEQVKKNSDIVPPTTTLKAMAMAYVKKRFPNMDVAKVDEEIEAALGALNALKVPAACPPITITTTEVK